MLRWLFLALPLALMAGVALAGTAWAEAADWIGKAPYDLVQSAEWRGPLVALLGRADLQRLQDAVVVADPIAQQGDWVVAVGCAPHQCGDVRGGVAISQASGKVVAVLRDADGVQVWGDPADLPPGLAEIVQP